MTLVPLLFLRQGIRRIRARKKKCSPGLSKSDGVSEPEVNLCDTNKFLKLGLALRSVILQLVPP